MWLAIYLLLMPLLLQQWSWSNSVSIYQCLRQTPYLQTSDRQWRHNINTLIPDLNLCFQRRCSNFMVSLLSLNLCTRLITLLKNSSTEMWDRYLRISWFLLFNKETWLPLCFPQCLRILSTFLHIKHSWHHNPWY